jgi:hypothetical protein
VDDVLLLVAVRTDQPSIAERLATVLAVARPYELRGDPVAYAKPVAELTQTDRDALRRLFDPADVDRLRLDEGAAGG